MEIKRVLDKFLQKPLDSSKVDTTEELRRLQASFVAGSMAHVSALVEAEKRRVVVEGRQESLSATELQMQVAVLTRQLTVAKEQLKGKHRKVFFLVESKCVCIRFFFSSFLILSLKVALEEAAVLRSHRVVLCEKTASVELALARLEKLKRLEALLLRQSERHATLMKLQQQEKLNVKHVINVLRTLLDALDGAKSAHVKCIAFWKSLSEETPVSAEQLSLTVSRCVAAACGDAKQDSSSENLLMHLVREAREEEKKLQAAQRQERSRSTATLASGLVALRESIAAIDPENTKALKHIADMTKLICALEAQRAQHESAQKLQHPDITAMERALMPLFWEEPNNPVKLNAALTKLKERLKL